MSGHVVTLIGGKGGVGKSLLTANLAFAFSVEYRIKVGILDLDRKSAGDQSLITGLRPVKTFKDLVDNQSTMNPQLMQTYFAHHKLGVSLLSLPTDLAVTQNMGIDGIVKSIKSVTQAFPLVIIDAGSDLDPFSLKILEASTLILVVGTQDLLVVNQTKKILAELQSMMFPKEIVQVLLNQVVRNHPLTQETIERQLGKSILFQVQKDEINCISSLSKSQPLLSYSKSGPFAESVLEIAKRIKMQNILGRLEHFQKPVLETNKPEASGVGQGRSKNQDDDSWNDLKMRIHRKLVEEIDFKKQGNENDPKSKIILREKTKKTVVDILGKEENRQIIKSRDQMNQMIKEVLDEALGLGPLEDLLADKSITEIMVVGPKKIYYEQSGKNKLSPITFTNDKQVQTVIERIVAPIGRRIDEKTPYVDARLADGSRVHAVIPPCSIDGCVITIRKFPEQRLNYKDLVQFGSMTQEMADFLRIAVEGKKNIVISGGTGSGKTTLINIMAGFIPANERIITVEDSAELDLPQEHVVRLETRPPSIEGEGEIDIRTLVKQTLRMRPDRIVVGECRGGEALDMLQAMNTGHDGSMTSVHSNSPRDCLARIETLVQYAGAGLNPKAIREMMASAVHLIVQQSRLEDGSRKVLNITEVNGIQGEIVTLQDIFVYKQEGMSKQGKVTGKFQATGFIPKFVESLERKGYKIPRHIFNNAA